MSLSQFANQPVNARFEMRFVPEVQILMRLLEAFALRDVMPTQVQLELDGDLACLVVHASLGAHDAQVLATRLSPAFGVFDVDWRAEAPAPAAVSV